MRLDKYVSQARGVSRSQAKDIILSGRVLVDGAAVRDPGAQVRPGQMILTDGQADAYAEHVHLMLHKPAGVLTATTDARAATVLDLVPPQWKRRDLCPVGRLDRDTLGLLLLTTDGQLAHRLLSPRWKVDKTYRALVQGHLTAEDELAFEQGIALHDFNALPARMRVLERFVEGGEPRSWCEVTVVEGKFHQVKRMFASRGAPVLRLSRLTMGPLALDPELLPGQARLLLDDEIRELYAQAAMPLPDGVVK